MNITMKPYQEQLKSWPPEGRHIMAQYTEDAIIVYQAYRPSIGHFARDHQYFGGDFSYHRMSWIKPNFLWMMYRSGWGTKPGQEVVLAIHLHRHVFDQYLSDAVASSFSQSVIADHPTWQQAVADSNVRLQWDPDHKPCGANESRKAIQLGIRGSQLQAFKGDGIIEIEDISPFVAEQRKHVLEHHLEHLMVPEERVYVPKDRTIRANIKMDEA